MIHERICLSLLLWAFDAELHKKHQFACIAGAYHERAQQAFVKTKVVKLQAMAEGILPDVIADSIVDVVHQVALLDVEYLVKSSRDMKAHSVHHVVFDIGPYFFLCQPSLVGKAKLQFVAVAIHMFAAEYRHYLWQLYLTDSDEVVFYLLLLGLQLLFIFETLPFASATHTIMFAHWFCAQGRILMEAYCHGLHI